jgi:hypothetical protein
MCNFFSNKILFYPTYIRKNNIVISVSYLKVNNDIIILSYDDRIDMKKIFPNCKKYKSDINNFYILKIKKDKKYYNIIYNFIYNKNKK